MLDRVVIIYLNKMCSTRHNYVDKGIKYGKLDPIIIATQLDKGVKYI